MLARVLHQGATMLAKHLHQVFYYLKPLDPVGTPMHTHARTYTHMHTHAHTHVAVCSLMVQMGPGVFLSARQVPLSQDGNINAIQLTACIASKYSDWLGRWQSSANHIAP